MLALKDLAVARKRRISKISTTHREKFAQYLTPIEIARFMAQLCLKYMKKTEYVSVLDPGAGSGILSCCLIDELYKKGNFLDISLDAWEIDDTIIPELTRTYKKMSIDNFQYNIHHKDFINNISQDIYWNLSKQYDLVIMNPPYKKIHSDSIYRHSLRDLNIETVNTYSAFMALAIKQLSDNGILTAIVPRSFCNGLYFLPFRKFLLDNTAILHIHSFETRDNAFRDENVLQENIIIVLKKNKKKQKYVIISFSKDKQLNNYIEKQMPYTEIISTDDKQMYISIPTEASSVPNHILSCSNDDLYFNISTGPIVDFRLKDKLEFDISCKGIPLLYPVHIRNHEINWPVNSKKANAVILNEEEVKKVAFPKGYYVLVKRFSSKEEKRRLYATMLTPNNLSADYFTVENHLNIIHYKRSSLNKEIALGLTAWLNTTLCDNLFRNFSGHTQVNATDLRNMKYPSEEILIQFGRLVEDKKQEEYDQIFEKLVIKNAE
jgi:adenine-specific DNA-methyltransferase